MFFPNQHQLSLISKSKDLFNKFRLQNNLFELQEKQPSFSMPRTVNCNLTLQSQQQIKSHKSFSYVNWISTLITFASSPIPIDINMEYKTFNFQKSFKMHTWTVIDIKTIDPPDLESKHKSNSYSAFITQILHVSTKFSIQFIDSSIAYRVWLFLLFDFSITNANKQEIEVSETIFQIKNVFNQLFLTSSSQ